MLAGRRSEGFRFDGKGILAASRRAENNDAAFEFEGGVVIHRRDSRPATRVRVSRPRAVRSATELRASKRTLVRKSRRVGERARAFEVERETGAGCLVGVPTVATSVWCASTSLLSPACLR